MLVMGVVVRRLLVPLVLLVLLVAAVLVVLLGTLSRAGRRRARRVRRRTALVRAHLGREAERVVGRIVVLLVLGAGVNNRSEGVGRLGGLGGPRGRRREVARLPGGRGRRLLAGGVDVSGGAKGTNVCQLSDS